MTDSHSPKIAVLGGGSWATAIVKILLENTNSVSWWVREEEIKDGVQNTGHNPLYLSSVFFPASSLTISNDIAELVKNSEILILAIPSAFVESAFASLSADDFKSKIVCCATKGLVPSRNQLVGDYLKDVFNISENTFAVVSGPSHAEEVALERLSFLTIVSKNAALAKALSACFSCRYVRTVLSDDVVGIEYIGVLKNVYALAMGIAKGLAYGDNFAAVLAANALAEMEHFLNVVEPYERRLSSSVYIGDFLVTSYSQFSRNRTFGNMIGSGYSVKATMLEMKMVAEGYYAVAGLHEIKQKFKVSMPILESVYSILYEAASPASLFHDLEQRML